MEKFIIVNDKTLREKLILHGFIEIKNSSGIYTFLNTDKLMFSDDIDIDKSKIQYSNNLCI